MLDIISTLIGHAALFLGGLIITILPFMPKSLAEQPEQLMLVIGFTGQGLFAMRFIIQWLKSEGAGRSVIPLAFWYFSIGGGMVLFLYALWRKDPVIICGQGVGLLIYGRNLYLIFQERAKKDGSPPA